MSLPMTRPKVLPTLGLTVGLWNFFFAAPFHPTSIAWGQSLKSTSVTIESLIETVVQNNPELELYEQEIIAAKATSQLGNRLDNPDLELSLGRKTQLSQEGTTWSVSVAQPFEFPGRLALRKAIANRKLALAQLGLSRFKAALRGQARLSAYQLLAAQQLAAAARDVAERGRTLVSVLVQRESGGITPLLEMRIIEANVIALQRRAIDADAQASHALFELNQLAGEPFTRSVKIIPTELQLNPLPKIDKLLEHAYRENFELQMKVEEIKVQGFEVALAKNERYPRFTLQPFISQEKTDEREQVAGLGISVPLPLWNQNSEAIALARGREAQARTSLELARREVERETREQALSYSRKLEEIQRWRPTLLADLKEAATLADQHYRLGAIPVSLYIELQTKFVEALEGVLEIQQEALASLQALETTTGMTIGQRFSPSEPVEEVR